MANVDTFNVGGVEYGISKDATDFNTLAILGKYSGRNLETVLADEIGSGNVYDALHNRIANADFSGLHIRDYIDVPLVSASSVTSSQSVRFLLAHADPYYKTGDQEKGHHLAFVAATPIPVSSTYSKVVNSSYIQWNTSSTNQGNSTTKNPYLISNLKTWENAFEGCLPQSLSKYILTQRVLLEERYSSSGSLTESNGWSWQNIGKVWSLSETEVYGQLVWGTKGYSVGFDCQFDLFHDTAARLNGLRTGWWLRSVQGGSSSGVCFVSNNGYANYYDAALDWVQPRVGFLLG